MSTPEVSSRSSWSESELLSLFCLGYRQYPKECLANFSGGIISSCVDVSAGGVFVSTPGLEYAQVELYVSGTIYKDEQKARFVGMGIAF